ncbi:MAG: hypothetical protein ACAI25_13550, partial [Planctomycetota bacterium]
LAFIPPELVVFFSAWVGCALVALGLQAHAGSRRGSALAVAKALGRVGLVSGLAGLGLGLLGRAPLEMGIGTFLLGLGAASVGSVFARCRAPRPAEPRVAREPARDQIAAVLAALARTFARGIPAALVGCAVSLALAAALFATVRVLLHTNDAPAFDRLLGPLATVAVLATVTAVLLPAHAMSLAAFAAAARGERRVFFRSLALGPRIARRVAPATFLLVATPLVWQVVVSINSHRFHGGCEGSLLLLVVLPFLWLFTRYAFVGASLALDDDEARALARAGKERLGRGDVLALLLLGPVLLLAFTPTHEATLERELHWLRIVLPSANSDSEAWLRVARVLTRSFLEKPGALGVEAGRIVLAILTGSGVACAALVTLGRRHDAPRTFALDKAALREVKPSAPGRSGAQGSVGVR